MHRITVCKGKKQGGYKVYNELQVMNAGYRKVHRLSVEYS
jgi:hypothetical protein